MEIEKKFQDLIEDYDEGFLETFVNEIGKIEDLSFNISDFFEKQNDNLLREFYNMLNHMKSNVQGISNIKLKNVSASIYPKIEFEITFIFEAINISFKDNRSYTIRLS